MRRFLFVAMVAVSSGFVASRARADEAEVKAVLDKAIKALGGEEKLSKVEAYTSKSKGVMTINGTDVEFTTETTIQGLDYYKGTFEGDFDGNAIKAVSVLKKDKGWRKINDMVMEIEGDGVANERWMITLQVIPATIVPLKGKGYKVESAGEEKVGDAEAVVLKVTADGGKDFTISFDKKTGLPLKTVATVVGFDNAEYKQESLFNNYKDFDGIKKATKLSGKRDGEKFVLSETTDFKVIPKPAPETFDEPK